MTQLAQPAGSIPTTQLVGAADDHLTLGTTEGDLNAAKYSEWIEALRERQTRQKNLEKWIEIVGALAQTCKIWLEINSVWAAEIAVSLNSEPESVSLYVVVKNQCPFTLDQRRSVADMALLLGGGFGVRAEGRITSVRPENHSFIIA